MANLVDLPRVKRSLERLDRIARDHPELRQGGERWSDNLDILEEVTMATPGKDRQRAYRDQMREQGFRQVTVWLDRESVDILKRLAAETGSDQNEAINSALQALIRPPVSSDKESREKAPQEPLQGAPEAHPAVTPPTEPKAPEKPPEAPRGGKPKLRKGARNGEWRVFVDGREIGTVTKQYHPAALGMPAFNRWRIHRRGSAFDALSNVSYRTRDDAVKALLP